MSWAIREALTKLHQDKHPSSQACALFILFKDSAPRSLRGVIDTHGHQIFATFTPEREAMAEHLKSFCDQMADQIADEIAHQSALSSQRATTWTFGSGLCTQTPQTRSTGLKIDFLPS